MSTLTRLFLTVCLAQMILIFGTACSGGHDSVPRAPQGALKKGVQSSGRPAYSNLFSRAGTGTLQDADYDAYINTQLSVEERALAHRLMALEPPRLRGDFIYFGPNDHIVSNNQEWLSAATISHQGTQNQSTTRQSVSSASAMSSMTGRRGVADYSNSCSPPNPPSNPGGPYVRAVSQCGFVAGWGFVNVPGGTSSVADNDAGHLYFELQGPQYAVEGGLEYYNDLSIAPYMRTSYLPGRRQRLYKHEQRWCSICRRPDNRCFYGLDTVWFDLQSRWPTRSLAESRQRLVKLYNGPAG
jgi:hypothetical protein